MHPLAQREQVSVKGGGLGLAGIRVDAPKPLSGPREEQS